MKKVRLPKETGKMTKKELKGYALQLLTACNAWAIKDEAQRRDHTLAVKELTEKLKHPTYEAQKSALLHELAYLVNAVGHAVRTAMWSTRDIPDTKGFGGR